ncbi:MAG: DnaJ family molecular chaperone [Alphaproteobacteria bacterium]|nr:DnaJ family molecular chaperone [Alphaproteobacteria bacterium]
MSIWGKIVGGAAGFAVGGPLGALLGGIAGHAVDKARDEIGQGDVNSIAFTIGVIALGAKMAKVDGQVTAEEVRAFREVFRVPESEVKNVARVFNLARRDVAGFESYASQIGAMFRGQPKVLENLLDGLFHIARADGRFVEGEDDYLRRVATLFGFSDAEFATIRESHVGPDVADPYRVLGVARDAPADQVKKRWRALVRENHPDALTARGVPQEFIEVATQKVAAINAAYDKIAKERGFERSAVTAGA